MLYSLLALGLIIVDKRYDHLGRIRRFLSVVAYPVQIAVASPFEGWNWFRESVTTRDALRADKARLEAQLRLAQFKLQRYEALEAESQRLRALRDNTAGVTDRFIIGNIMDVDLDAFRERVLVDKGAQRRRFRRAGGARFGRGVRPSRPRRAAHQRGHSGQRCRPCDPGADQPQRLAHHRRGHRRYGRLKLPYLPTSADVVAGDLLVTSGLGGGFPAGYPVGTVAEVKRDPAQSLADVDVQPAAALDRSRELMFVWLKPGRARCRRSAVGCPPRRASARRRTAPPAAARSRRRPQTPTPGHGAARRPRRAGAEQTTP